MNQADILVWRYKTERVMKLLYKLYSDDGDITAKFYELPNISPIAVYKEWRDLYTEYDYHVHKYLEQCTEEWWNYVHFDGCVNSEKQKALRQTFDDRRLFEACRMFRKSKSQKVPRHLRKKKQLIVNRI